MLRKTIAMFAIFLIAIPIVLGFFNSGSKIVSWYSVEDWELEVCSMWSETEEARHSSVMQSSEIYLSQLTLTLQGKKIVYPDNSSLYEFAWYIQPAQGNVEYEVLAYNENNTNVYYVLDGGIVSGGSMFGAGGYKAIYSNETYTRLKMNYKQGSSIEYLDVQIIVLEK